MLTHAMRKDRRSVFWRRTVLWTSALAPVSLGIPASAAGDEPALEAGQGATVPPKSHHAYLQYGVALAAEGVASAGPICSGQVQGSILSIFALTATPSNCILGSGGGISARAGWRPSELLYFGGSYEMTKQDPNQLYRLGILQMARAEGRRYFPVGRDVTPFVLLAVGLHGYGNEWGIDTWGPDGSLGGGLEVELGGPVLDLTLAYRAMDFSGWTDTSHLTHPAGVAQFLAFEVSIEAKDAL
jgi:hypothetical protein